MTMMMTTITTTMVIVPTGRIVPIGRIAPTGLTDQTIDL
jgi:hypothetical protein